MATGGSWKGRSRLHSLSSGRVLTLDRFPLHLRWVLHPLDATEAKAGLEQEDG